MNKYGLDNTKSNVVDGQSDQIMFLWRKTRTLNRKGIKKDLANIYFAL